jgi:serine/threonine protein kinase
MIYCINPKCKQRENPPYEETCQACGTPLLVKNRYRLLSPLRPLTARSHAEIFEIEDLGVEAARGERYKVLKVLKKNDATLVRLFRQEAEILQQLHHPGIPQIQLGDDYFTIPLPRKPKTLRPKTLHCLVLEKVHGENLKTWVKKHGTISQEQAWDWLKQLLEIVDYLHRQGYLHRDIKPSNIMRQPNGQLMLIDFGTVRRMTETYIVKIGQDEEGTCVWSAGYTPDEVMAGKAFPQSDFYAIGRTFVYLLTGKSPLKLMEESEGLNWREGATQVSSTFADWIDYLMASSPLKRPPNTSYLLKCLQENTADTLPPPPTETLPVPSAYQTESPTPRWLILLNFALFSILLLTGFLRFQNYQDNRQPTWERASGEWSRLID